MKTLRGKHSDGYVVIKLYIKPESGQNLAKQVRKTKGNSTMLAPETHLTKEQRNTRHWKMCLMRSISKESRRQIVRLILFDLISTAAYTTASGILSVSSFMWLILRLISMASTRPFLTTIEKKWIAYQLLRGIADSHAKNVYHGDIKTENVLVTSWNWAYLVDYAFYKPTYLPEVSMQRIPPHIPST